MIQKAPLILSHELIIQNETIMEGVKKIRPTYPPQFSIGLLLLVFIVASFLAHQIFRVTTNSKGDDLHIYIGMFLVGVAVIVMALILWEEIMFPVNVKVVKGGLSYRNHRSKLMLQVLIYLTIPAIFVFIYLTYEINLWRFVIWAGICCLLPIIGKIASGLNNYNDYLTLTTDRIEYKNNHKEGSFEVKDIAYITIIKDKGKSLPKIKLYFHNNRQVTIDLDEMELYDFYDSIFRFISIRYRHLLR